MKHFISLKEFTKEDLLSILHLAQKIKAKRANGQLTNYLSNKTLIMLFQKTSTRTRLSFEAGMTQLGGHAIFLDTRTSQLSSADFVDEMRAIMRFGDALVFRALRANDVVRAASLNVIPVIDACSEKYHPAQALGDMLTMMEYARNLENIKKVAWLGIENNVSNSLKLVCAKLGIKMAIISPEVDPNSVDEELNRQADASGKVMHTTDLVAGLAGADFVHTDTWMNMEFFEKGEILPQFREEYERRKKVFMPYQLNAVLMERYAPRAKIMHCMPCHVGYEITRDAIDCHRSIIFDQAENRMHMQKAIILWLLETR